jgi:hypothetical protein
MHHCKLFGQLIHRGLPFSGSSAFFSHPSTIIGFFAFLRLI